MKTSIITVVSGKDMANNHGHKKYAGEHERWAAVTRREREADGAFYYAVRSTGVYCRPSCSARLARRENVEFFGTCAAAEAAGFRPCKRCQPNGPALDELHAAAVAKVCRVIQSAETAPRLTVLARTAGMSPFHFHRVFTRLVGLSPKAYADASRAERVRKQLLQRGSVTEAIYEAGYSSNSRFYAKSSEMLGMQPRRYQRGGAGETIRFAFGGCSLGTVLVAASEKGVCSILLGDKPGGLLADLLRRFRGARLVEAGRGFTRLVSQVVRLVENPRGGCPLPLDIQGTAFQQRVWRALREIPAGSTLSYAELAVRAGLPKAARAVAGACAANPLAVAIPCHRVRRADGSLAGYRWGLKRKQALLRRENPEPLR